MSVAMQDLIIIASQEDDPVRRLTARVCAAGHPPCLILLGSRPERIVLKLAAFGKARRQYGLVGALRWLLGMRDRRAEGAIREPPLSRWGIPILEFERVNGGRTLLEIIKRPGSLVLLAGCEPVDRAFLAVAKGRCLAWPQPGLSGADGLAEMALAALAGSPDEFPVRAPSPVFEG